MESQAVTREEALEKRASIQKRRCILIRKKFTKGKGLSKGEMDKLERLTDELDALSPILYPEHHKFLDKMLNACDAIKKKPK